MDLRTPRLCLDALRAEDAEALFGYRADPAVSRYQGWRPASLAEVCDFIERQAHAPPEAPGRWVQRAIRRRDGGALIGDLGLHLPADADGAVEFGITIAPAWQGRGYAGEALREVFGQLFGPLGHRRVLASVDPRNAASMALLRSLGMRQEAHHRESLRLHGEWVDDVVFALLAREWPGQRLAH
ncbi:MAG: GNAT family N-acetyltransferase [Pseudomonadota bacterium]|nr:GNAT family N-acetyltransferase [Pseudomonadota bacterium]